MFFPFLKNPFHKNKSKIHERELWHKDIKLLKQKHLKNCQVIADRTQLLHHLPKKGIVAEIGVEYGFFSKEILKITKPKKMVLVDIILTDILKKNLETSIFQKVEFIKNDSVEVLKKFPEHYFDWVYIDSSHEYVQTKKELELCRRKVKKGGYICGHDYILFSYVEDMQYGVVKAVNEFCIKNNWEIRFLTLDPHGYYSFALKEIFS
jgi:predicted O-methyltransferase YrrM